MHKTSVYTVHLFTAIFKKLAHRKQQKSQKVILPASHWLCGETNWCFVHLYLRFYYY